MVSAAEWELFPFQMEMWLKGETMQFKIVCV